MAERWMSARRLRAPGVCSATAPASQTMPSATAAASSAPPTPSTTVSPGIRSRRRSP
jgi:hypothetical protein